MGAAMRSGERSAAETTVIGRGRLLFVFDDSVSVPLLDVRPPLTGAVIVDFFPLVSDHALVDTIEGIMQQKGFYAGTRLDTAMLVDVEVGKLRRAICAWSADVGEARVCGRTVKDWFVLPGMGVSAWWFGLVSEKNTGKTDAFLRVAQVQAVAEVLAKGGYDGCVIGVGDRKLRAALKRVTKRCGAQGVIAPARPADTIRGRIKQLPASLSFAVDLIRTVRLFATAVGRSARARRDLGVLPRTVPNRRSLLFVSYFPLVDKKRAAEGVFVNRYGAALQEWLRAMQIPVQWVLIWDFLDGYDHASALRLARRLVEGGERLFMLDEFRGLREYLLAALWWVRQTLIGIFLYPFLRRNYLSAPPIGDDCLSLVMPLWMSSFCGSTGMDGILYAMAFDRVFRRFAHVRDCLYYCEMHAWEKALNAAKERLAPQVRSIGFQHANLPRNLFNYFYDPRETARRNPGLDLPLPDVLASNGQFPCALLAESEYPGLAPVESVRHLYLNEMLSSRVRPRTGRPTLLVAGSIDRAETRQLLGLVRAAFPHADGFDLWYRGHPAVPIEAIFRELGWPLNPMARIVQEGSLLDYLLPAWAVVVPSSSVAIEALACGCEVIVPVFSGAMMMNPLWDIDGPCHHVANGTELAAAWQFIREGQTLSSVEEKRAFVRRYWHLEPDMPRWTQLLSPREGGA